MEDWEKVSKAFAEIGELPLEIYDNAGVTVQDIWMQTRKLKRKHGDKKILIIVDYLQLITGVRSIRAIDFRKLVRFRVSLSY